MMYIAYFHPSLLKATFSRFVSLKQRGQNFWWLCPFHDEKTPSFSVSPEKGIFKCFGCGKGGNLISFVQAYERLSFKEALTLLADYLGIPLTYSGKKENARKKRKDFLLKINDWVNKIYRQEISHPNVTNYLKKRKINLDTQNHFLIGYAPPSFRFLENAIEKDTQDEKKEDSLKALKTLGLISSSDRGEASSYNRFKGRLILPIRNLSGECIGFGGRILEDDSKAAKYINSPESELFKKKDCLYHLNYAKEAIRKNNQIILVEGYFDVIGLYQKEIHNVVAPLGTAFTKEQARLLRRYSDHLIIFFDSDSAGIEAAFKALKTAKFEKIKTRIVSLPSDNEKLDPFDIALKKDPIDILSILDSARNETEFILWYFFVYKYNINDLNDKKIAITEFFSYIQEYHEHLWEKLEFIEKSQDILQISQDVLKYDFKQFMKTQAQPSVSLKTKHEPHKSAEEKNISRVEKDILAVLLKFPELWGNEHLLEEINWSSDEMYLLFHFFRDRLKTGQLWKWEHLNEVMPILPENLSALLSGIILEFEVILEQEQEKNYSIYLKKMILHCKLHRVEKRLEEVQNSLNKKGEFKSKETESLAMEFRDLIEQKKRIKSSQQF